MTDDLQRLLARDRRPHHLLDVPGVAYFQDIHANPPSRTFATIADAPASSDIPSSAIGAGDKGAIHTSRFENRVFMLRS
jgi:hypothetical protein